MAEKKHLVALVGNKDFIQEALQEVTGREVELNITPSQLKRAETKVRENITKEILANMEAELNAGNTVEFKNLIGVKQYESSVYKTESGASRKKFRVLVRKPYNDKINK